VGNFRFNENIFRRKRLSINNELSVKIDVLHLQQRLDRFCPNMLGSPEYILGA
jgi:hypothetical protein